MKRTPIFIAACAGMAFFGVTMLSLGPILTQLNAAVAGATALPSTMSIGIIVGTLLFGPVVDRFGYKALFIVASLLALVGVWGLGHMEAIGWLHASIFALGFGGGILNGETNALVSDIYDDAKRPARLGFLGAFYCIGALLWTLLNYFMPDYRLPLAIVSAMMAIFIIYFCFVKFPKRTHAETPVAANNEGKSPMAALIFSPALLLFGVILFFQSGFEGVSGSFTVDYLNRTADIAPAAATLSLTAFTVGMLAGRLPLGAIMNRLHQKGTLYLYLSVALLGVALLWADSDLPMPYVAMALIGFGVGATYPVVIDYISSAYRRYTGTALSIAMFVGLLGQFAFNKCMGLAFDSNMLGALPAAMIGTVAGMMLVLPLAVAASKKVK